MALNAAGVEETPVTKVQAIADPDSLVAQKQVAAAQSQIAGMYRDLQSMQQNLVSALSNPPKLSKAAIWNQYYMLAMQKAESWMPPAQLLGAADEHLKNFEARFPGAAI